MKVNLHDRRDKSGQGPWDSLAGGGAYDPARFSVGCPWIDGLKCLLSWEFCCDHE